MATLGWGEVRLASKKTAKPPETERRRERERETNPKDKWQLTMRSSTASVFPTPSRINKYSAVHGLSQTRKLFGTLVQSFYELSLIESWIIDNG